MSDREAQIAEILDRIKRNATSRDALSLLIVKLLELRHADMEIKFVSEAEIKLTSKAGKSHSIFLHNIWSECERTPEERDEIVDRYLRVLAPVEENEEPFRSEIVIPVIRETEYCQYIRESERSILTKHLVGDLWTVLAMDLPESIRVMSAKQIESSGLDTEQLLSLGIRNLDRLLGEISMDPYGECYVFSCENTVYASSILLLDHVWKQAAELVQSEPVIAVPARDTILFTGVNNARGIEELRQEAAYVFRTGNHLLTETLLSRSGGQWKLFH